MTYSGISRRQFLGAAAAALMGAAAFAVPAAYANAGAYIFPNSDTVLISPAEIQGMSAWQLYLARNEIYARHGYIFASPDLRQYFNSQGWYVPRYDASSFDESVLNYTEQRNIAIILERERAIGSPYISGGGSGGGGGGGTYILPQSSTTWLSTSDIAGLNAWQLYIARNEIYARHGYGFSRSDLADYFNSQPWYKQVYAPGAFDDSVLSNVENANIATILDYERSIGSPYL